MAKWRNKKKEKEIAKERIEKLFKQARETFSEDEDLAHKYVGKARKMAMRYRIRIRPELQRQFCKHCYSFLMPGKNCRVRTKKGKVVYTCLECNKHMRFPTKRKE